MKFKTTKKNMRENYNTIIGIGYCKAQSLLRYHEPLAYSTRAEGWACDYFEVNNILISTGYAPLNNKNVNYHYDLLQEYEVKARQISCNYDLSYENQKTQVTDLLKEFVSIAISNQIVRERYINEN